MSFEYLAYEFLRGREVVNPQTVSQRWVRDVNNPFHPAAGEFRLTPDLTEDLISQLRSHFRGSRITAISAEKRVLAALQFLQLDVMNDINTIFAYNYASYTFMDTRI